MNTSQQLSERKFFVPFAENKEQETKFYQSIKNFVSKTMEVAEFSKMRIRFLWSNNQHKNIKIEVGKYIDINGEIVIAILYEPSRHIYHICTPSRGVVRGRSFIIQESSVIEIGFYDVN
jgi:hypothetical protein